LSECYLSETDPDRPVPSVARRQYDPQADVAPVVAQHQAAAADEPTL